MNIFVKKYLSIQLYSNICHALVQIIIEFINGLFLYFPKSARQCPDIHQSAAASVIDILSPVNSKDGI